MVERGRRCLAVRQWSHQLVDETIAFPVPTRGPLTDQPEFRLTLLDGRFQLEGLLGRGGMADVFRARDLRHGRPVAVKILREEVLDALGVERFRREIALTAAFTHPHILALLESGETVDPDGRRVLYYVMPLIEGETLRDLLDREDHLPLAEAIRITREMLEALRYAHDHNVIHRDIKPGNILLSGGHAVVADFGIARPVSGTKTDTAGALVLTMSGVSVGTPAYMSPEQAYGDRHIDARCDVYAAGCVLYEMLTGCFPFDATSAQAVMARKMNGTFVPPTSMRRHLPPMLDEIVGRALQPDPADRFASASAFLTALDGLGEIKLLPDDSRAGVSNRRTLWRRYGKVGALVVVLVVALSVWGLGRPRATTLGQVGDNSNLAADPSRVAVLPFENLSADTSLRYVADGLTTDLIDELAQVRALTVVSKNGVLPFRGKDIGADSVARALNVGSVITGDVRGTANGVTVSVRLIDGRSGRQVASHPTTGTQQDLLGVRSSVIEDVTGFLRERLGEQVRIAVGRRRAQNGEAWQLVERARSLRENVQTRGPSMAWPEGARQFQLADSLLTRAARLDRAWPEPLVERGQVSLARARAAEFAGLSGAGADGGLEGARRHWREAVRHADDALARDPEDASALDVRGKARSELWRTSLDANSDSLRVRAEGDLRAAVDRRPDFSQAWHDLSALLALAGDFAEAERAAAEALRADEYLLNGPTILQRLQFAALGAEHSESAARWCAEGRRRYPQNLYFLGCELTTVGWTATKPADVGRAWALLDEAERRDTANMLQLGSATRRLFVAAVAARAGLRDSALAIVALARASLPKGASTVAADYGEAHVRALLGQNDEALRLLDSYLKRFPIQRRQVARMPWFRSLRADLRFIAMTSTR